MTIRCLECNSPVKRNAHKFCSSACYHKYARTKRLEVVHQPIEAKVCTKCGETKHAKEYFPDYRAIARGRPGAVKSWCKQCHVADNVYRARKLSNESEEYREHRRETTRVRKLKQKYGMTKDDYLRMLEEQGGGCAICGATEHIMVFGVRKMFVVDHDHNTGKPRGILCDHCNRAIGLLRDNADVLRKAADYIERHRQ